MVCCYIRRRYSSAITFSLVRRGHKYNALLSHKQNCHPFLKGQPTRFLFEEGLRREKEAKVVVPFPLIASIDVVRLLLWNREKLSPPLHGITTIVRPISPAYGCQAVGRSVLLARWTGSNFSRFGNRHCVVPTI